MGQRAADLVQPGKHLIGPRGVDVHQPDVVNRALGAALGTGAVVRDHADDCVGELTSVPQEIQDAPDLLVGMREEPREALHETCRQCLLMGAE